MAPRRRPSSDFFGVRERPSGQFAAEITADGVRWWIGTFDSEASPDAAATRAASIRPAAAGPQLPRHRTEQRRERANLRAAQIDELRMETLRSDQPELVQAELDFFAGRKKKKAAAARADGAGLSAPPSSPPNRINVGSCRRRRSSLDSDSDAHVVD
ncbi:hypothetical protein ZWY2020_007477 [Hordeum vulgare]|nr:hypothetical protein ZWY2020_007477 [Hordeum vulgare]